MRRKTQGIVCALIALAVTDANADATLTYGSANAEEGTERSLLVKGDLVGFIDPARSEEGFYALFDKSRSAFTFINHRDRQYTVITEQWMQEANQRSREAMQRMRAEMEKQLEKLPPDQRARYQQAQTGMGMMPMMGGLLGGMAGGQTQPKQIIPSLFTRTVNGMQCRRLEVYQGGRKTEELCVAAPGALKIDQNDYETLRGMLQVGANLSKLGAFSFGFDAPTLADAGDTAQGVPVEIQNLTDPKTVLQLRGVNTDQLSAQRFDIPADYLEAQIPLPH